jgi:hypothetical protein
VMDVGDHGSRPPHRPERRETSGFGARLIPEVST